MGVWLLNFTPVPTRQNQGFLFFLNTQSGVKTIDYFHCTCMNTLVIHVPGRGTSCKITDEYVQLVRVLERARARARMISIHQG